MRGGVVSGGMTRTLISAIVSPLAAGLPTEIVYVPDGKNRITPQSHPKGIDVNVPREQGEAIAAALQADLDKLLARNVEPWFDFEHSRKYPTSGFPKSFRYQPGEGIMCSVEWSRSGRIAVRGKDVRYFSPEVYLDEKGIPCGLPERGPLGGLVTEPAFREIRPVTASDADPSQKPPAMSAILLLASIGLLTQEEASAEGAETLARTRLTSMRTQIASLDEVKGKLTAAETERDGLKTKLTAAEAEVKKVADKRADDLVKAAIEDGRIAPKDEDTAKDFRERLSAGDAFAEKVLTNLPKLHEGLEKTVIKAGAGNRPDMGGGHALEKKARALVTANQADSFEDALGLVAASEPDLYSDYLKSLSDG